MQFFLIWRIVIFYFHILPFPIFLMVYFSCQIFYHIYFYCNIFPLSQKSNIKPWYFSDFMLLLSYFSSALGAPFQSSIHWHCKATSKVSGFKLRDLRPSRAFLLSYVPKVYGLPSSPVPPVTLILDFRWNTGRRPCALLNESVTPPLRTKHKSLMSKTPLVFT